MRILVTGAAGFIGSLLAESLSESHEVIGIDGFLEFPYSSPNKLRNTENFAKKGINLISANLCDLSTFKQIPECEAVIHLAAMPGLTLSWEKPELYIENNILATANLAKHFEDNQIAKFIFISTSSVYGKLAIGDENSGLNPISPYGVTKLAAEKLLLSYHYERNLPLSILRIFSVFGPRQRSDMMYSKLFHAAIHKEPIKVFGDGSQSRTNTYVGDIVDGIEQALYGAKLGEIYNLGGGEEITLNKAMSYVEEITGKELVKEFVGSQQGDQYRTSADTRKAQDDFGFSPKVRVYEGLEKQYNWIMSLL
jgi:nucleoside-diphosphate-sugar epimerase